jgi:hypothetical protein
MNADWNNRRETLLRALQSIGSKGRAEGEAEQKLGPGFYPVAEHLRVLEPEVVLVVGPRGAGKTEIARVLTDANLASAIAECAKGVRLPTGSAKWLMAYPRGSEVFDAKGLRTFIQSCANDNIQPASELWFAYLLRVLKDCLDDQARDELKQVLRLQGGDIDGNYKAFQEAGQQPLLALDRLDEGLQRDNQFIFITYDELDTLGGADWGAMEAGIRGLVAFWASYARRWRRIRAKIFLRSDLYERFATAGGADLAKLAANRVDLAWSDADLYAMLLKRIVNASPDLKTYVQSINSRIEWQKNDALGEMPKLTTWQDARPVVERMFGPYMGANKKKGLVYRWLLDHVRDGRGRALPRPFVRLIEEGANLELQERRSLREPRLLEPSSIRRSLDRVSDEHVAHARDEWPWLDAVKVRLKGQLVPWERERDLLKLLRFDAAASSDKKPPFDDRELLDYLIEVGILRRRSDGRVDAPDLFLHGLGLLRKGGVRRF